MGDLTAHFSRWEIECGCGCGLMNMTEATLIQMERLRVFYGKAITVTSGSRCPAYNEDQGGKPASAHLDGYALDMRCSNGREKLNLVEAGMKAGFNRFGIGTGFVHVDCHPEKSPDVMWSY